MAMQPLPGHHMAVKKAGGGGKAFVLRCECGYLSAKRATETMAMAAGIHHWKLEVKKLRENGLGVPRSVTRAS